MIRRTLLLAALGLVVVACEGAKGPAGAPGRDGTNGQDGQDGSNGTSCTVTDNHDGTHTITCTDGTSVTVSNGATGGNVAITDFHGAAFMKSSGEYATGKFDVKVTITSATAAADGTLAVDFTAATPGAGGQPVPGIAAITADVAKLVPGTATERASRFVPYITRIETATTGDWPNPAGTTAVQGNTEGNGALTDHGDGSYTYVFATNLANATTEGAPVGYQRNLLHRVSVMIGGHDGPTGEATFDFVPDGSAITTTRNIVQTAACKACHGEEFHGHGGNRLSVENCATCHVPGTADANGGQSLDLAVMIHKIHAGGELASLPGADGKIWDDPSTPADESADNGEYAIWGYRNTKHEWWKAEFPAVLANCQKCHTGTGAQVDNWKTNPTRQACGSCHDTVDFATGANHLGGAQADDSGCATCHGATTGWAPIVPAHDWTTKDPRNVPEFDAELSLSAPANGKYYVAGEAPVVTVVLKDKATGTPIDHDLVTGAALGCLPTGCPAPTSPTTFANTAFFVSGPRATRNPVLTTTARAKIEAAAPASWDLSGGAALALKVDNGRDVTMYNQTGGDFVASGTISVTVPAAAFANPAAATPAELAAGLNAIPAFSRRAIAYVEGGRFGIRSRNLGRLYAIQLDPSAVTTAVFGGDTALKLPGGYYPSNTLAFNAAPGAANDRKVTRTAGSITYQLDPVDDLQPGTYVASVEISRLGRVSETNYRTPTVAKVAFQVKTAAVEKPIASNCNSCHQSADGRGFVLDFSRHNKIFSDDAVDQCGACHDYQPGSATGAWLGGHPISKRVHAVHFGSSLFTPLATVAYSNGDPVAGRNWDITFPQDVRNCQACHPDGTSSGTWAARPNRLACWGCHDGDAAKAHMALQTLDPTPANPWSGDEQESCQACH